MPDLATPKMPPVAIGQSSQGRPIRLTRLGHPAAPLRVLIFGGQHGDEPLAREAVRQFASNGRGGVAADVQIALIADANPDGAAAGSRTSADGIDLNRDHQLLRSLETQALHRVVRQWRPHLIIDVHTYPPRRRHLLEAGLIHCHDVFLDVPTNPAIRLPIHPNEMLAGIESIAADLNRENFLATRYVLIRRSGRIRHSTPDVIDARNMFALRYGIPTILLEGRQPSRRHDPPDAAARTVRALNRALDLLVEWTITNQDQLIRPPNARAAADGVPIGSRYAMPDDTFSLPFRDAGDQTIRAVLLDGRYTPAVQVTDKASLPAAYAVPRDLRWTLETLIRHGFDWHSPPANTTASVHRHRVTAVIASRRRGRSLGKIETSSITAQLPLDDYLIFPTEQPGGAALAVFLEPKSKYGLPRYETSDIAVEPGCDYPILRCESAVEASRLVC
jgi:hypothetical protein